MCVVHLITGLVFSLLLFSFLVQVFCICTNSFCTIFVNRLHPCVVRDAVQIYVRWLNVSIVFRRSCVIIQMAMGKCSVYSSLQADSMVRFATWPTSWRPPGADRLSSRCSKVNSRIWLALYRQHYKCRPGYYYYYYCYCYYCVSKVQDQ